MTSLEDLMRAADPLPGSAHEPLTLAQIALRDDIMGDRATGPCLVRRGARAVRRFAAPVLAVGVTASLVVAAVVSLSAFPLLADRSLTSPSGNVEDGADTEAWEFARERATSDFELGVLADGRVTTDEYREAQRRFVECVSDAGLDITITGSAELGTMQYNITSALGESGTNDVVARCGAGTIDVIEGLYMAINGFPDTGG